MKKLFKCVAAACVLMSITSMAYARDTRYLVPIQPSLANATSQGIVNGSVKLYFGNQSHPRVVKNFGEFVTNPKSNGFGKSDANACDRAFQSAVKALQNNAQKLGANAVINIVSYHDKRVMSSTSVYECHAGAVVAGITLKGDFVKLAR